ncbi:MAG: hypothetical protein AAGH19_03585 [Pseudomonadota bacterium]
MEQVAALQRAYSNPTRFAIHSLMLAVLWASTPVFAQDIVRRAWTCGNLQSQQAEAADYNGASMTIEYPVPRGVDFLDAQFAGANIVGFFEPPEPMNVTFRLPNGGGAFTGQPSEVLYAQQSGEADLKSIGFFNAGIGIGASTRRMATTQDAGGTVVDGSVEFRNADGGLIPVTNAWDPINFADWLESRCGASIDDAGSGVLVVMEGTVTEGDGSGSSGEVTTLRVRNLEELLAAREVVNSTRDGTIEINFEGAPNFVLGEVDFTSTEGVPVFFNVLGNVSLQLNGTFGMEPSPATGRISFMQIRGLSASVTWTSSPGSQTRISGFGGTISGAINSEADLTIDGVDFVQNFDDQGDITSGGAIAATRGSMTLRNCGFYGNLSTGSSEGFGGAISIGGLVEEVLIERSIFRDNLATTGNDIYAFAATAQPGTGLDENTNFVLRGSSFEKALDANGPSVAASGPVDADLQYNSLLSLDIFSPLRGHSKNSVEGSTTNDVLLALDSSATITVRGMTFDPPPDSVAIHVEEAGAGSLRATDFEQHPKAPCNANNADVVQSRGDNAASVAECELDQPTDLTDVDLMLGASDERGVRTPLASSPLIDAGRVVAFEDPVSEETLLPCGFVDLNGLGRPQDGNGDGIFECDIGATEFPGEGVIQAGHSAAYFNAARGGEGQYVEILSDSLAVVYNFSYDPQGTGASWFVALADIVGNSLVMRDVLQPVGTSWGGGFDAADVERTPWGGMSMVLPGCPRSGADGNVAFSGNTEFGFEPLITRAQKLTDVAGCGSDVTAHPNAGLSGSFYDANRDGEGLIVQWLPDGRVVVIMFTFGPGGNQLWITGSAPSDGKSVSIEALYPTAFTSWGSGFVADQVQLDPWGTFNLTWQDCNTLSFELVPSAGGFGGRQTRSYTRLTTLQGTSCPGF